MFKDVGWTTALQASARAASFGTAAYTYLPILAKNYQITSAALCPGP
jgi:hypothetical protein